MRRILSLLLPLPLLANDLGPIIACEQLKDYKRAFQYCQKAMGKEPQEESLQTLWIKLLARAKQPQEALAFLESHPHLEAHTQYGALLEEICWAILQKGIASEYESEQAIALLGAVVTQDAYGIPLCQKAMEVSHWRVRALAATLAPLYHDQALQEKLLTLFRDPMQKVRIAAFENACFPEAREPLIALLQQTLPVPEKLAILSALVKLSGTPTLAQVHYLLRQENRSLQLLGCLLACQIEDASALLADLTACLNSASYEIQIAALLTIGLTRLPPPNCTCYLQSPHPPLALTAAWLLQVNDNPTASALFERYLNDSSRQNRLLAAAALAKSGSHGTNLCQQFLERSQDPLVKANLAINLLEQREHLSLCCQALADLVASKELLAVDEECHPLFTPITDQATVLPLLCTPEELNQLLRMQILNFLAILRYPGACHSIESFLKDHPWIVTAKAARSLLQEGDAAAADLVVTLLDHPDQQLRIQAALLLASFFHSPKAVDLLITAYPTLSFEKKLLTLEALADLGAPAAKPLFLDQLKSNNTTLRIAAASGLLRCLNS